MKEKTMNDTVKPQGIFLTAQFDRLFERERKNQDGTYTKVHYLGLICRTENNGTRLFDVRTKKPEKYSGYRRDQVITIEILPRAFNNNIYYSDSDD